MQALNHADYEDVKTAVIALHAILVMKTIDGAPFNRDNADRMIRKLREEINALAKLKQDRLAVWQKDEERKGALYAV